MCQILSPIILFLIGLISSICIPFVYPTLDNVTIVQSNAVIQTHGLGYPEKLKIVYRKPYSIEYEIIAFTKSCCESYESCESSESCYESTKLRCRPYTWSGYGPFLVFELDYNPGTYTTFTKDQRCQFAKLVQNETFWFLQQTILANIIDSYDNCKL